MVSKPCNAKQVRLKQDSHRCLLESHQMYGEVGIPNMYGATRRGVEGNGMLPGFCQEPAHEKYDQLLDFSVPK